MEGNFFRNSGHRCQLEEEVQSRFTTTSPSLRVSGTQVFTQVSETSAPQCSGLQRKASKTLSRVCGPRAPLLWARGAESWDARSSRPLLCLPVPRAGVPLVPLLLRSPHRGLPLITDLDLCPEPRLTHPVSGEHLDFNTSHLFSHHLFSPTCFSS